MGSKKLNVSAFLSKLLISIVLLSDVSSSIPDLSSAKIVFYYGPTYDDNQYYNLQDAASILNHPNFVHSQTNCFMHGYNVTQDSYGIRLVVESYLKRDSINLLSIDWGLLSAGSYTSAQQNLLALGPEIANALLNMIQAGLDKNSLSIVGHSLGALGAGIISREVNRRSLGGILLPRLTGLDPSNAAAHDVFILPPIETTDAQFVNIIHTDAGGTGTLQHMGHADFWPNGGSAIQPGCPAQNINDKCSHRKAWAYWAQSVAGEEPSQLLAYRADSYEDFLEKGPGALNSTRVPMGIDCPPSARGDYYLQTDSTYGSIPGVGLPK